MAEVSPDPFSVVAADQISNPYEGSDVPGEFRSLTEALGAEQVAITLIRVPPHSDFEQGTGHRHDEHRGALPRCRGTLTMRFGNEIRRVGAGSVARVAPATVALAPQRGRRAGRALGDLRRSEHDDATKVDDFWEASPEAAQRSNGDRAEGG